MRKILCPRCGAINLEKFVTFPHCANCGTLLPWQEAAAPFQRAWQRPLRPLLWLGVLAGASLALVAAVLLFETAPEASGQVVIYGQSSRVTQVGHLLSAQFTVDTIDAQAARPPDVLSAVKLRIPRHFFDDFDFIALDPAPDEIIDRGTGRYFQYAALPRETRLQLSMRARQTGRHRLNTQIYADDYSAGTYRTVITVQPVTMQPGASPKNRGK
ncbi:MAG TPA: hypothetical protein VNA16_06500 [Abditibacteriaceae bacterium]|nr:hypothetical protein [Abditibacteriaceae bacterium]